MNNKKFKNGNVCLIIFLFCFIMLNVYFTLKLIKKENTKNDIIRIHVVANSNSIEDQLIKLKVYERIDKYIKNLNIDKNISTKEILNIIESKYQEILDISNETLRANNKDYNSSLDIGKIYYDEKNSILLDMPKDSYNSIRIKLGNADGENIWSIIFPDSNTIENLSALESILPGISNIYKKETAIENNNKVYSIKLLEIINLK